MTTILISADRYNQLQRRISAVLTNSTNTSITTGWGQSSLSDVHYPIIGDFTENSTNTDLITAQQYKDLYIDIVRSRVHQIGASNFVLRDFVIGDFDTNNTNTDIVEDAYISDLETLVTTIEQEKFLVHSTQYEIVDYPVNQRTTGWNQSLVHEFKLTFASDLDRRHFFNSGGEILISAELTGDTSQKGVDWSNILNYGLIKFNYDTTVNTFGLSTQNYGNYNLPSTYTTIFLRTPVSYVGNLYKIEAKSNSSTELQFKITFDDVNSDALGPPNSTDGFPDVDELVGGTTSSYVQVIRPFGTVTIDSITYDTVKVAQPTYTVITNLSSGS